MDAAEPGRLMVLGDGGIRDVVDPRRDAIAMVTGMVVVIVQERADSGANQSSDATRTGIMKD
jgi:hypothetical protein